MGKYSRKRDIRKQSAKTGRRLLIGLAVIIVISAAAAILITRRANGGIHNTEPSAAVESTVIAEPTVTEASLATVPTEEPLWINNVLMPDEVFDSAEFADYVISDVSYYETFVFNSVIPRRWIRSITFLDTLKDAPDSSWDVSEPQDGSVRAWVTNETALFIGAEGGINAKYCKELFYGYHNVSEINFNHCFHTDYAASMRSMFACCYALSALDLGDFNTANATDMSNMFRGCYSLTSLDLSSFDTSSVTNMRSMFYTCSQLTNFDLSSFDTSNVTDMSFMFSCCEPESLDLSSFNTSSVTDMRSMFDYCRLTSLDLSNFDTSLVTDMSGMFRICSSLTDLNISGFRTSNVVSMENMFSGSSKLETINGIEHFDTQNVVSHRKFMDADQIINGHPWEDLVQFPAAEKPQFTIAPAAKKDLISILEDYQAEYGDEVADEYRRYPNGDAAFLADLDGDGADELVLNKWHDLGDESHDGSSGRVVTYYVYQYQNGAWRLCEEPPVIGSAGFAGWTHWVYRDGKALLAVLELESDDESGLEETQTVTLYNNITQQAETFAVTSFKTGFYDAYHPITTEMTITYTINGESVTHDQFVQTLSAYEGISYQLGNEGIHLSFDNWSGLMPTDLIRELRGS